MGIEVGSAVKYDPDGYVMPIDEDQCQSGECVGVVVETDTVPIEQGEPDMSGVCLVRWGTCCFIHDALTSGHLGESWERTGDLALI